MELRNDQVDPKEHEQAGEPKQDIAEREDQSARAALVRFDLGGRDQADAARQLDREDHRRHYGDDGYVTQGSPVDMYQAALFSFCFLAFLGLGGA